MYSLKFGYNQGILKNNVRKTNTYSKMLPFQITRKLESTEVDPDIWDDDYIENLRRFLKAILQSEVLRNHLFVNQIVKLLGVMMKSKWTSARFTGTVFGKKSSFTLQLMFEE